jgi:hypothetical protein
MEILDQAFAAADSFHALSDDERDVLLAAELK